MKNRKRNIALILLILVVALAASLRGRDTNIGFVGEQGDSARFWPLSIDAREPCWLRVRREDRPVIRVNCFAIDGVLYTHSNRFVPVASLFGKSWTQTVAQHPELEVLVEDRIYSLRAERIESETRRRRILVERHYTFIPDGIQVYALLPRSG
jgi:hypothetical protein